MSARIHPTAIVDPGASLGREVEIGPFAIIGPNVIIGDGCHVMARATLERNVRLGAGVQVGIGSVLGGEPQDLKFGGEETWVEVGEGSRIREYATINRGTAASGCTSIGAPPRLRAGNGSPVLGSGKVSCGLSVTYTPLMKFSFFAAISGARPRFK